MAMFFFFLFLVGNADEGVAVGPNTILELSFTEPIRDYVGRDETDPFGTKIGLLGQKGQHLLFY